jgi:hypothetical protein
MCEEARDCLAFFVIFCYNEGVIKNEIGGLIMPKIGSNYDKERFESLYKQIAEHDENFTVDHVRSFVEDALSKIDAEYLEAIENILLGKDGKTAELSAYFDTDDMFLDEEDKVLAERDVLSVVTFLHGIANGKYTLLNQRKE